MKAYGQKQHSPILTIFVEQNKQRKNWKLTLRSQCHTATIRMIHGNLTLFVAQVINKENEIINLGTIYHLNPCSLPT